MTIQTKPTTPPKSPPPPVKDPIVIPFEGPGGFDRAMSLGD
ncbi:hypothetical protein [Hyphomonas sp.]|jgi:hypothetical protein